MCWELGRLSVVPAQHKLLSFAVPVMELLSKGLNACGGTDS